MKHTLLSFLGIFISCLGYSQSHQTNLVGRWKSISTTKDITFEFKTNKKYLYCSNTFILQGNWKKASSNSIILYNNGVPALFSFKFDSTYLYLTSYKGFDNHIDEVFCLERCETIKQPCVNTNSNTTSSTCIIPKNLLGYIYINYNQKTKKEFDKIGNPIIRINQIGLHKCAFKEDPIAYIQNNMRFLLTDDKNGYTEIQSFIFSKYESKLDVLLKQGFDLNSVYVCLYGYNQMSRESLNKITKQSTKGNVLIIKIDTLKNMLYDPFNCISLTQKKASMNLTFPKLEL